MTFSGRYAVYLGGKAIDGAAQTVERMRKKGKVLFLTNNTSCSRRAYAAKLSFAHVEIAAQRKSVVGIEPSENLIRGFKAGRKFLQLTFKGFATEVMSMTDFKCYLLDMDGTVYLGGKAIDGAAQTVAKKIRRRNRAF